MIDGSTTWWGKVHRWNLQAWQTSTSLNLWMNIARWPFIHCEILFSKALVDTSIKTLYLALNWIKLYNPPVSEFQSNCFPNAYLQRRTTGRQYFISKKGWENNEHQSGGTAVTIVACFEHWPHTLNSIGSVNFCR